MNVEVRIGRLVLDGVELRRWERAALPGAIERELGTLLEAGAAGGLAGPPAVRTLAAPGAGPRVQALAREIAGSVHRGIGGSVDRGIGGVRGTRR